MTEMTTIVIMLLCVKAMMTLKTYAFSNFVMIYLQQNEKLRVIAVIDRESFAVIQKVFLAVLIVWGAVLSTDLSASQTETLSTIVGKLFELIFETVIS